MVKITNGTDVFEVTRGAFNSIYSHQGYSLMEEEDAGAVDPQENSQDPEKTGDEQFLEDIVEKPISQWNKNEVKKYAEINGIDLTGTKNANEAKEIIKQFMEENED